MVNPIAVIPNGTSIKAIKNFTIKKDNVGVDELNISYKTPMNPNASKPMKDSHIGVIRIVTSAFSQSALLNFFISFLL